MITLLRTSLLILIVLLLPACGGGGTSTSSSSDSRGSDTVQPEQPDDGTDNETPEAPPPVASDLTTNVFFPVFDTMALYYDADTDPAVLGETQQVNGASVYPLQHPDERVEYLTSTTHEVGLQRLYLKLVESTTPVFLDIAFSQLRTILGNQTIYSTSGTANVSLTGIAGSYPVPVTLKASRIGNELIDVAGWPAQPARHIRLEMNLTVNAIARFFILQAYPWAEPLLDSISLDLYFVPGVGIARIQQGEWRSSLNRVEGIPQPHVFNVLRNADVNGIEPVQMQIHGEVLVDSEWQADVYYRTTGVDWLEVTFDDTGSWRARLSRSDLAPGVYAATVRFTRGEAVQDTTVSLLIR